MSYKHLTKEERYYIEQRKANVIGISLRTLGREMGRHHSTLSREIRRNTDIDYKFYSGIRAQTLAVERIQVVQNATKGC